MAADGVQRSEGETPASGAQMIDLFCGIGGMALAVHAVADGVRIRWACDCDPDCREVMRVRFGLDPALGQLRDDVRMLHPHPGSAALVYGGFPCQDVSGAGRGLGVVHGGRSSLFEEMIRVAAEARAPWLFMENVSRLATNGLAHVLRRLREEGWTQARAATLAVSELGGRHRRRRIFILARNRRLASEGGDAASIRYRSSSSSSSPAAAAAASCSWRDADEPDPRLLEGSTTGPPWSCRVRMLGNTCVPQQGEAALRFLLLGAGGGEGEPGAAGKTWDQLWEASAAAFPESADPPCRVPCHPGLRRGRLELCPTLVANDRLGGNLAGRREDGSYRTMTLARWVRHKPRAGMWGIAVGEGAAPLRRGAIMDPAWACWLMGFPRGWLDLPLPVADA